MHWTAANGGIRTSTLAPGATRARVRTVSRTAVAIAADQGRSVALMDASFQFGDVGVLLNLNPKNKSIVDVLGDVGNGDVDGWVWGPGSVTEAPPPPDVGFDDICDGGGATGATAVAALSTPAPGGTAVVEAVGTPVMSAPAGPSVWAYGGFVVLLLLLGGLLWLARRRAGRGRA